MNKSLKRLLRVAWLNRASRMALAPWRRVVPAKFFDTIPVVGEFDLRIPGTARRVRFRNDGFDDVSQALYWRGLAAREPATMAAFVALLDSCGTFIDVGANIGVYALVAAALDPQRRVHALEPVPRVFERLQANIAAGAATNVRAHALALSSRRGTLTLYVPKVRVPTAASSLEGFRDRAEPLPVPAMTLDEFVREQKIESVDLIKIDTEATEHEVLAGACQTLRRDEPIVICEVLKGRTERQLQPLLEPLGYTFWWITPRGLIRKPTIEGDGTYENTEYLFLTEARQRRLAGEARLAFTQEA